MVCLVPSLPATLFAHPFPDMFASAWLLISPCSHQDRLVCFFPSAPTTLFAHLPHRFFYMAAGWGVDSWVVWVLIECESPVTSPNHAPHAASLALGVFPPSLCFLCVFFLVVFFGGLGGHESWLGSQPPICHHIYFLCFLGGWEAVNPCQVRGPPAAIIDSFYLHIIL